MLVSAVTAYALLTRGIVGFAVPLTLLLHRRSWQAGLVIAMSLLPLLAWYAYLQSMYGNFFWEVQSAFLSDKINQFKLLQFE